VRLNELFPTEDTSMSNTLQQAAMDMLVPMAGQRLPFVTVQQVIDELRNLQTGVAIDRAVIMDLLSPDNTKVVKKIEGDRIYLQTPNNDQVEKAKEDEVRDAEKIKNRAQKQAKKEMNR